MHPSDVPVFEALGGKYIPIKVDREQGCTGCAGEKNTDLCRKLPRCAGRNFCVIYEEIA